MLPCYTYSTALPTSPYPTIYNGLIHKRLYRKPITSFRLIIFTKQNHVSIVKCTFKHIQGTICLTYSQEVVVSTPNYHHCHHIQCNLFIHSCDAGWYSTYPPPPPPLVALLLSFAQQLVWPWGEAAISAVNISNWHWRACRDLTFCAFKRAHTYHIYTTTTLARGVCRWEGVAM